MLLFVCGEVFVKIFWQGEMQKLCMYPTDAFMLPRWHRRTPSAHHSCRQLTWLPASVRHHVRTVNEGSTSTVTLVLKWSRKYHTLVPFTSRLLVVTNGLLDRERERDVYQWAIFLF